MQLIVKDIRPNGQGNLEFELGSPDGSRLPDFSAGSHVDVKIAPGIVRQYSLCNGPEETNSYLLCVRLENESRGGSAALHTKVRVGDVMEVSPPRNLFPMPAANRFLLFAAGIGITPILSMAKLLTAQKAVFELNYYVRTFAEAAFSEFLTNCHFADNVILHASNMGDSLRSRVPQVLERPDTDTAIMVCGPSGFMQRLRDLALQYGWREDQIFSERFSPEAQPNGSVECFEVQLASTGRSFLVERDQTIASVLSNAGIPIDLSCEQGICGACLTPVVEGVPDHRDTVLSVREREANDQMTICCSRARSKRLVLGL